MSSSRQTIESVKNRSSIDSATYQVFSPLNQTFGAKNIHSELTSITTLDTLREERSKFDAFLSQLDDKVEYGFANEMEDDFERLKCYKFPQASSIKASG